MNVFEKLTVAALLTAAILSATLYGLWEDKVILYGPLLVLVYAALAVWVTRAAWRGQRSAVRDQMSDVKGQESEVDAPTSDLRPPSSGIRIPPGGVILILFFLYSAVMIPFAVLPYEAKISTLRFGCYLGTYWAAAKILSRFSYRKAVWLTLLTALVFIALYSLVEHRTAPNMIFGLERFTAHYWPAGRLAGTYICPNHIAHLYQMWIPFCLVFLFIPQFGWFWRICIGYALPLFLFLIYQTQSRAGLLGVVAGAGTTVLFTILRKSSKLFWVALLVIPLLCAGAVGGLYVGSSMFRERMQPVFTFLAHQFRKDAADERLEDFRPQTWLDTIDMIKARPVFGFGPGNYSLTYEDYHKRVPTLRWITVHAHNEYLEMTAEYGLVGAALALGVLIRLLMAAVPAIRSLPAHHALPLCALLGAVAGTAVHGFFDFELRVFPNAMMLALLAGCAVAPLLRQQDLPLNSCLTAKKRKSRKKLSTTADAREAPGGSEGRGTDS